MQRCAGLLIVFCFGMLTGCQAQPSEEVSNPTATGTHITLGMPESQVRETLSGLGGSVFLTNVPVITAQGRSGQPSGDIWELPAYQIDLEPRFEQGQLAALLVWDQTQPRQFHYMHMNEHAWVEGIVFDEVQSTYDMQVIRIIHEQSQ